MVASHYLVIVGTADNPLYEAYLGKEQPPASINRVTSFSLFGNGMDHADAIGYNRSGEDLRHVLQLIAHSSLDVIEDLQFTTTGMYLKVVDEFHEWLVSAWLTSGGTKIILLHATRNEEGIRLFLQDVWENYVKTLLNPFYEANAAITSSYFDKRVQAAAAKYL